MADQMTNDLNTELHQSTRLLVLDFLVNSSYWLSSLLTIPIW